MAKYVRTEPPSKVSWPRENGIAALFIALGVTITVPINVYVGIGLVTVGAIWWGYDFGRRLEGAAGWVTPVYLLLASSYALFLWMVLVPAPLMFELDSPPGNYKDGEIVLGIPWKATYHPVRFLIGNSTSMDYSHFDLYARTSNLWIAWPGFSSELNQCQISRDMPNLLMRGQTVSYTDAHDNKISIPLSDEDKQHILSTVFCIKCDKIASKSLIEVLLPVLGLEEPSWVSIDATFEAANMERREFIPKCTLSACTYVQLPKAFE